MKFWAAARVLVLIWMAACVSSARDAYESDVDHVLLVAPTPDHQVAAVGELAPHPWKVGQWATYRTSERGYETISAVAIEACGTWFSDEIKTYTGHARWLICLRALGQDESPRPIDLVQVVIGQWNDGPAAVADFRARHDPGADQFRASPAFARMVARLMPATWQGDTSLRETIDVPAGHFAMTVRTTETIGTMPATRWAHPDVPFDGTVWVNEAGGKSYALIAYGETGAPSIVPELAAPNASATATSQPSGRARFRDFIGFGAMSSWFTGLASERSTGADGVELQDGIGLTSALALVSAFAWSSLYHYSPDPTMNETTSRFTVGVHWLPFARATAPRARFSMENFYVRADLGYARLDRGMGSNRDEVASGFAAGAGLGWTLHLARGLGLGAELSDHVLFFNNDDIAGHSLAATVFAEIYPFYQY